MKHTMIVVSTNRGLHPVTLDAVRECRNAGARLVTQSGASDVSLARNCALTIARKGLDLVEKQQGAPPINVIMMLDDDMAFGLADAQALVDRVRLTCAPASATYVQAGGMLSASIMPAQAATRRGDGLLVMRPNSWQVGLGFMAFPAIELVTLAEQSDRFEFQGEEHWEFTRSGAIDGFYVSEDYCLSRRLGGVELLPLEVGHLKMHPLYPHENILAVVREHHEAFDRLVQS